MYFPKKELILNDLRSGTLLFFVTVPLSVGIALASGAPVASGIISSIVGGSIVLFISGSRYLVSGPAAGMSAVLAASIMETGSFSLVLFSVILAGIFQVLFGLFKGGDLIKYIPQSVIKGVVSAIGIILIVKQLNLLGFTDSNRFNLGSFVIFVVFIVGFVIDKIYKISKGGISKFILSFILLAILANFIFDLYFPFLQAPNNLRLALPKNLDVSFSVLNLDFYSLDYKSIFTIGLTFFFILFIEGMLTIRVIDMINIEDDASTDKNRELIAQGIGNIFCGLLGGLPLTSVVVRSSVNYYSKATTLFSTLWNTILLLISIFLLYKLPLSIPYCIFSCVLIFIGIKLVDLNLFLNLFVQKKTKILITSVATLLSILLTDLLVGMSIGFMLNVIYFYAENDGHEKEGDLYKETVPKSDIIKLIRSNKILTNDVFVSIFKSIIKGTLLIFSSALITYLLYSNHYLNYENNVINHLQVFGTILAILAIYTSTFSHKNK